MRMRMEKKEVCLYGDDDESDTMALNKHCGFLEAKKKRKDARKSIIATHHHPLYLMALNQS